MNRHAFLGLFGKGVFASAAVVLMFGGEQSANAVQIQQLTSSTSEYRVTVAQPAALPTVTSGIDQQRMAGREPRWVF